MRPNVLLLYAITNEKTVKLMQLGRLLSASKTSPAGTRSNNSGRYTLVKSHIPWVHPLCPVIILYDKDYEINCMGNS